jgi:hypothetical protein
MHEVPGSQAGALRTRNVCVVVGRGGNDIVRGGAGIDVEACGIIPGCDFRVHIFG